MPALSPTMTEGNIAKWALKEGDSFSAGDVLLEIETDKASMDVEAQDDGILAKIIQGDGSKAIQVGARIGVLAETGDDLASLEIPEEESSSPPKKEAKPEPTPEKKPEASKSESSSSSSDQAPAKKSSGPAKKQTRPLLPSVEHLIHEKGLDQAAIDKMTPSGPNNRLLKGDVLAYLGSISESYPAELSSRISKLSHLDLSNIKLAPPPAPKPAEAAQPIASPVSDVTEVSLRVSLKSIIDFQNELDKTGREWSINSIIMNATKEANTDLPLPTNYKPSSNELFNEILGLSKPATSSRGNYMPELEQFVPAPKSTKKPISIAKKSDVLDLLTATKKSISKDTKSYDPNFGTFYLKVPKAEVKRANVFLQRLKTLMETKPEALW